MTSMRVHFSFLSLHLDLFGPVARRTTQTTFALTWRGMQSSARRIIQQLIWSAT